MEVLLLKEKRVQWFLSPVDWPMQKCDLHGPVIALLQNDRANWLLPQ